MNPRCAERRAHGPHSSTEPHSFRGVAARASADYRRFTGWAPEGSRQSRLLPSVTITSSSVPFGKPLARRSGFDRSPLGFSARASLVEYRVACLCSAPSRGHTAGLAFRAEPHSASRRSALIAARRGGFGSSPRCLKPSSGGSCLPAGCSECACEGRYRLAPSSRTFQHIANCSRCWSRCPGRRAVGAELPGRR
jgi:hypothetical protein